MSKKHYIAIAGIFKTELDDINKYDQPEARRLQTTILANRMANYFASESSQFDRGRFLKACGV